MVKTPTLNIALLVSALLHAALILALSQMMSNSMRREQLVRIDVIAAPPVEEKPQPVAPAPPPKIATKAPKPPAQIEKKAPAPVEPPQAPRETVNTEATPVKKTAPDEAAASAPAAGGDAQIPAFATPGKGGGSESGTADVALPPGPGV